MPDVFKMLQDLELKAVGLDPATKKLQEGYFVAFRNIGLPVHKDDYANPFTPLGPTQAPPLPKEATDPKDASSTGSAKIDPNLAFSADLAKSMQSFLSTYALVDNKLQMNNMYSVMPGSSKLADTWFAIVSGANGIPPTMELNAELKKSYEAAASKLMDKDGNVTPHYQAYMDRRDMYTKKVRARNAAYSAAFTDPVKLGRFPVDGVPYQEDVEEAWDQWTALGFKEEIETAINSLAAQGMDPAIALIARSKKKFQSSLLTFPGYGLIPYVAFNPRTWYDPDNDDGWNEYTSTDLHSESDYEKSSTSYGGGGGFNVGLWSGSASFDHSDSDTKGMAAAKNVKVKFKYAIVDIDRPWLDTSLLNLGNWFLVGDYKKNCISTGLMNQEKPNNGTEPAFLPSVVTSLILAKDVNISWDDWKSQWEEHTKSNAASASVGIWCFTANAHYAHAEQQRHFSYDDTGESLVIPGIQVIGYVSQIMPASPQKNSADYLITVKGH